METKSARVRRAEKLASRLAPEDVRPGDFIAVLHLVDEHLTCGMLEDSAWRGIAPVRVAWLPREWEENEPLKVVSVCLPFVCVKDAQRKYRTLDVRRYRLVRLPAKFARAVRRKLRRDARLPS